MTRLIQTNHSPFSSLEKIPWKKREVQARSEKRDEDTYLSRRKWIVQGRSILLVNRVSRSFAKPAHLMSNRLLLSEKTIFFLTQHHASLPVLLVPRPKEWSNNVNEPS